MLNFRPATARFVRRLVAVLLSLCGVTGAFAAPQIEAVASSVAATAPDSDPVMRFLADRGQPASAPVASTTVDAGIVDRVRNKASDMVLTALDFLGVPYRRGGNTAESGFDCSGFTRHIFAMSLGLVLPRRADEQATTAGLLWIGRGELRPGDLVFFNTMRRTFSHVGIYLGEGKFIHSPKPGGEVRVDDLRATYWDKRFTGGRRAEATSSPSPLASTR